MLRAKFSSLLFWLAMLVLCPISGSEFISAAQAQTPTPSSEQIDVFRSLTPEQQRAVMESMGAGAVGGRIRSDRQVNFPQTVIPRRSMDETDGDRETGDQGIAREPRLKGDDTVLSLSTQTATLKDD